MTKTKKVVLVLVVAHAFQWYGALIVHLSPRSSALEFLGFMLLMSAIFLPAFIVADIKGSPQ